MLCEGCSENTEIQGVVRGHNRRLRRIVSVLRQRIQNGKAYSDDLFVALCDTKPDAESAMREIWERAGLECSPDDYQVVVETAAAAILAVKSGACTNRIDQSVDFCTVPPTGWYCTRAKGHSGPCAAIPTRVSPSELKLIDSSH